MQENWGPMCVWGEGPLDMTSNCEGPMLISRLAGGPSGPHMWTSRMHWNSPQFSRNYIMSFDFPFGLKRGLECSWHSTIFPSISSQAILIFCSTLCTWKRRKNYTCHYFIDPPKIKMEALYISYLNLHLRDKGFGKYVFTNLIKCLSFSLKVEWIITWFLSLTELLRMTKMTEPLRSGQIHTRELTHPRQDSLLSNQNQS